VHKDTVTDTRSHYNFVTDAWRFVLGENFHLGYFKDKNTSLVEATNNLIDELAEMGDIKAESEVLDVGCGIGEPAFYLHEKFHCSIIGITISDEGVKIAEEKSASRGYSQKVRFQLTDILNNEFSGGGFDIVWIMESSHLMEDKEKLFRESFRLLKEKGTLLICDMILKRELTVPELVNNSRKIAVMERVFGKAKTETLEFYQGQLKEAGFSEIVTRDVSQNALPTIDYWKRNIINNQEKVLNNFSRERIDEFLLACDIIKDFYKEGILGYGLVKAVKDNRSDS